MINKNTNLNISIIGLGYVGLPLALEFAKKRKVIGYDLNKSRIKELNLGIDKNQEFSKSEIHYSKQIRFTYNLDDLKSVNCFIITVPTPIDDKKNPDLSPLMNASEIIGKIIKKMI